MTDVFVCYAREDIEFVRHLHAALEERGRSAWVDWEGIPPVDKWLTKIQSAIDEADAFLFVISPDSIASEVCGIELEHATRQHKRLIPVLHREAEPQNAPPRQLSELNWIVARDSDPPAVTYETIISSLDTDLQWTRLHTRLLVRAMEWDRAARDSSFTLRGRDLSKFEEWLAKSPDKEPRPTSLQSEYLLNSRRTVTRRQRLVWGSIGIALSIAVGLGTVAFFQSRERQLQETIAEARRLVNKADGLRDGAVDEVGALSRLTESTRAAARALALFHRSGISTIEADEALRKSYAMLPKWIDLDLGPQTVDGSGFDSSAAHVATFQGRKRLVVRDTEARRQTAACQRPLAAMESILGMAVDTKGTRAATVIYDASRKADHTEITVWSLPACEHELRVQTPQRINRVAFGANGEILVVSGVSTPRIWDLHSRSELPPRGFSDLVLAIAPSPTTRAIATLERNRGERVYWIRTRALDTGQILNQWKHARSGNWLSWNANTLLVGDANEAWIYHPDSGRLIRRLPGNEHSLAVSRDGRFVARSHKDKRLQIIEMATGSEITRGSHDTVVDRLAFTPNGDYLATVDKEDRRIRFWSFRQSSAFAVLQEREPIIEIGFSDDTSSLRTRTAWQENLWRLPAPGSRSSLEHQPAPAAEAPTAQRYDLSLSTPLPDAGPATIEIRNSPGGPIVRSMTFDAPLLSSVASRARNLLAVILCTGSTRGGCRRHLETWDIRTGEKIASRQLAPLLDEQVAAYLDFAGGGQFLVASVRGGIEILDAAQLNPITTLYHPEVMLTAVNSSGSLVATKGKDDEMLIWDLAGSTMIARIPNVQPLRALALSNDQRWLAGLEKDGVGRLWLLNPEDLIQQVCRWLDEPCP